MNSMLKRVESERASGKKLFNGGSSYDWMVSKSKIKNKFIEAGCWSYIEPVPLAVAVVAGAVGVPLGAPAVLPAVVAAIVEDLFAVPKPVATVAHADVLIQNMVDELNIVYDANNLDITGLPNAVC